LDPVERLFDAEGSFSDEDDDLLLATGPPPLLELILVNGQHKLLYKHPTGF
jgi:hypothetical protein